MPADTALLNVNSIALPACFGSHQGQLTIAGQNVQDIAREAGTPLFLYAAPAIRDSYSTLRDALAGFARVYYSVKANPHRDIIGLLNKLGAGIEIASLGEYRKAVAAGAPPSGIVFAGPGKRQFEIQSALDGGIGEIHLESLEEAQMVSQCAVQRSARVAVSIRVNPSESAQGGAMRMGGKASAFGIDEELLPALAPMIDALPGLDLCGLHMYSGTQILSSDVLAAQWRHALKLARQSGEMLGRPLRSLDLGGGLGIPYHPGDVALDLAAVAGLAQQLQAERKRDSMLSNLDIIVEPGRYLVGPSGIYVMGVTSIKQSRGQTFVITDGGMHHHLAASGNLGQVIKRDYPIVAATRMDDAATMPCQIVGPLCTPLDTLARKAVMPTLAPGDLLAVFQSGAYGLSASPTGFLSHGLPSEMLIG